MIIYKENCISTEEYSNLTDAVGWGKWNREAVKVALENTIFSVSAYENEKIIGFGRIIGDKTIFLYIQDIMVLPEYQGKKIGTEIMKMLLKEIEELKKINPDLRVYLGASRGKEDFYKKFGFISREDAGLGEGMILI